MKVLLLILLTIFTFFAKVEAANETNPDEAIAENFINFFIDKACLIYGDDLKNPSANLSAKYARPLTSRVIECIDGTLSNIFLKSNGKAGFTLFQEFQSVVKALVILILILYVAVNGYLIATGQMLSQNPKQEIAMFFIKFIFVFYFAIGDAWKDFFFLALRSISSTLGEIVLEAGLATVGDGCYFSHPAISYPAGKGYLAIFDTLDCKFANYLGWFRGRKFPIVVPIGFSMFFISGIGPFIFGLIFVFAMQIVLLAVRVAQLYLASILTLTLLIYASPLIVPMVLFKKTEDMYQNWLKKIIGLTVHPVIVMCFVGILIGIMDRVYYGPSPDTQTLFKPWVAPSGGIWEPGQEPDDSWVIGTSQGNTSLQMLNPEGQGADIDPKCYGGGGAAGFNPSRIPFVCVMAWLEDKTYYLGLPVPYFIELIQIPLTVRFDLALMFLVGLIYVTLINFILGYFYDKLESLIADISGEDFTSMIGSANFTGKALENFSKGKDAMSQAQDKVFKRQSGPQKDSSGGKESNTNDASGGGASNTNDASGGKGSNVNDASGGKESNTNDASGGGASNTSDASSGAAEGASGAADAADSASG